MSAESPKYYQAPKPRGGFHVVTPQEVTDPSILDSVAGFINDVVPTSYTTPYDVTDQIQWAHFEPLEYDELGSNNDCEKIVAPPLILVLGYSTGIQVWCITANGEATEIIAWRNGSIKVLRILPSPHRVEGNCTDLFSSKRPLMALCDGASPGPPYCALSFLSLKTGEQVKLIKFKNLILDVRANRHSVVVSFSEKVAVFDAFSFEARCTVTTCYSSPGIHLNPIALGSKWLAYAEKTLIGTRKSSGGCDSEGVQSYKATVIQCAKSLGKGIKEFGETVANSLTGSSSFKPGVVCPGSPQIGGQSDGYQKGVVTILDIECNQVESSDKSISVEAVIAHFIAHNEAIVSLEFDPSGMLLLTADKRGHDFHIFRIHPHPVGSFLASVHHLYILHRGDTTAKVQDMCFSPDSRWVTVSTLRGTTHVFPITSYGGNVGVRTHTTQHVVNKMSRFHRSAGLTGEERSNSPVSGLETPVGNIFPYNNPRFPPYPHPTIMHPLAQIRQPVSVQVPASIQPRITSTRQRLSSSSEESISLGVVACFSAPRAYIDTATPQENALKKIKPIESLFIMGCHGSLIQYDLEPHPIPNIPKEKLCDDTPIELKTIPKAQWILQRPPNATDVALPLKDRYLQYIFPSALVSRKISTEQNDDYWLSQVEIVTHAGPHRRLWMGPQFTFKTYTTAPGCPFSLTNVQQIDIGRSKPVNMPVTHDAVFIECGSANSRELSPPLNTYHATFDEIGGLGELQLREDLADAMLESPGIRETGGRYVIVSMKPQAPPVAKVVNPLGTVVTIQSDEEIEKEQCEDAVIHENCDEALFRPIVAPKPILFSEGKPRTNPTDTMIVRSLDDTTEVAVKILDKNVCSNNPSTNQNSKYRNEKKQHYSPPTVKTIKYESQKENNIIDIQTGSDELPEEDRPNLHGWSRPLVSFNSETKAEISVLSDLKPLESIDGGLIFEESYSDFKDDIDFPYLNGKNDVDKELELKTDMFEDASDCCDTLLQINNEKALSDSKENFKKDCSPEEKVVPTKPRKPKMKLGVRIPIKNFSSKNDENIATWEVPNKNFPSKNDIATWEVPNNFPSKNEEDVATWDPVPKRSWSSIAAIKPKDKTWAISEKENCNIWEVSDEKSSKKSFTSVVKNVKLIRIETPADEDAAIEIVEPLLPEYRKNTWYPNILDKSSDEEKIADVSPGETTESDDSGKLLENHVTADDLISQNVTQTVSRANKKKSKKKRK